VTRAEFYQRRRAYRTWMRRGHARQDMPMLASQYHAGQRVKQPALPVPGVGDLDDHRLARAIAERPPTVYELEVIKLQLSWPHRLYMKLLISRVRAINDRLNRRMAALRLAP
jgi:hypothetical protein